MTILLQRVLLLATLLVGVVTVQTDPTIRIGLSQSAGAVTVRSTEAFTVQQQSTRSAKFTTVLAIDDSALSRVLGRDDLRYRMVVELDGGRFIALPLNTHVRVSPPPTARIQVEDRTYRGFVEVFGNARNTFTVVNELPLEDYLLGVVPNELSPSTFGELEALKAQAVAARTYAIRNMGQYKQEGYDICNTDACQVYFGAGTEDPLSTQAVRETRGVIATYNGQPISALYSSTCGGRTEASENIFQEKLPYLVSVQCEFKHPEPMKFSSNRLIVDYKAAVLDIALQQANRNADQAARAMQRGGATGGTMGPKTGRSNAPNGQNFSADGGVQILSDTKGYDFGPYMNQVLNKVRSNWSIPDLARFGARGRVIVDFTIIKNGDIVNCRIISESGERSLDLAAKAAIDTSNPFQRLPSGFSGDELQLRFGFYYNIPVE